MIPNTIASLGFEYELDHIAIAVHSLEEGKKPYELLGFGEIHTELVESQKVLTGFLKLGNGSSLELLEPTSDDSPVKKFLDKRGPGIHHICLRVKGIDALVESLKTKGIQMIDQQPKLGAHNCRVAFIHPKSTGGVLIELSEPQHGSKDAHHGR
ncbi:MAG: methylmalonyl-CoA epimerase [Proteobacteria bacterium]|nr:MAG: methylmalonyl-CoA epimerase [Pseudomonadota bacterium]